MKAKIGKRWSIHRTILFCAGGAAMALLTDLDGGVAGELVGRQIEVPRRGPLADAAGGVVLRAVAGAEPAAILAALIGRPLAQRHAAQMRAHADDDEPFRLLDARGIGLGVAQRVDVDLLRRLDLALGAVVDEDRLALPFDGEPLAHLHRPQIHFGGAERQRVLGRLHAVDERPHRDGGAHAGHRRCGDRQKIAPRRRIRGMRTHRLRLRRIRHRASLPYNLTRPRASHREAPPRRPRGAGYRRRGTYTVERFRLCDILPHSRPLQPGIAGGCSPWCLPNRARARFPPAMRLALYEPDIPQNAGALLRLGACLGVAVDIIEPCGFVLGDRRLKRAGLDYLADHRFAFRADDTLLLGRETAGVPDAVHQAADARLRVPMRPGLRSLNVALAAALVLGEALRQTGQFPTEPP